MKPKAMNELFLNKLEIVIKCSSFYFNLVLYSTPTYFISLFSESGINKLEEHQPFTKMDPCDHHHHHSFNVSVPLKVGRTGDQDYIR